MKTLQLLLLTVPLLSSLSAATVELPYYNDFTSGAADFTASANYTVLDGEYRYDDPYGGSARLAFLNIPEIGASVMDFTMSTTLSATYTSGNASFGFGLFSGDSVGSTSLLLADWSPNDLLRIYKVDNSSTLASLTTTDVTFSNGSEYTLTATGQITGTTMDLVLTISDGTNSQSVTASDIDVASYLSTPNFGYRTYSSSKHGVVVDYDNFSIVSNVPEPSVTAVLVGGFALGIVLMCRRKFARR